MADHAQVHLVRCPLPDCSYFYQYFGTEKDLEVERPGGISGKQLRKRRSGWRQHIASKHPELLPSDSEYLSCIGSKILASKKKDAEEVAQNKHGYKPSAGDERVSIS